MLYLDPPAKQATGGLLSRFRRTPARQLNAGLTGDMPAGQASLVVRVGEKIAGVALLEVKC
jgi:hypothetical protein